MRVLNLRFRMTKALTSKDWNMKYQLKVYSIWEFGQRKDSQGNPHQEDSLFPEFGKQSDNDRLFILCDGMGGHDAGEVASATVCEAMSQSIINDGHDKDGIFTIDDFNTAIDKAFIALDERDSGAEKKMGTTMTFLKLHNEGAFIAHMGDSRVYHIRPGKDGEETQILFETSDHSLVNDLIKIGELTKEEARHSKQKNVITRAMQPNMGRKPKADIYQTIDIKPGDYFYMCSDGMLEQPEMEDGTSLKNVFSELGGNDENKVEILKSVTEKNRDNHTAFIIHIIDVMDPIEKILPTVSDKEEKVDKFAAIVEDDQTSSDSAVVDNSSVGSQESNTSPEPVDSSVSTESGSDLPTIDKENKVSAIQDMKKRKGGLIPRFHSPEVKKIWPMVIRFLVAAIVVAAVIVGITSVKSCSSEKDNKLEEVFENKPEKAKQDNQRRGKTTRQKKSENSSNTTEGTAVQAANSSVTDNLTSGTENSQQSGSSQPSTNLLPQLPNSEDVVSSDAQVIQDNIKK